MSYQNDIFIDNCVMRLVQLAVAIRQNNDRLACQELDADELECQQGQNGQSFDACEDNATAYRQGLAR